MSGLLITFEGTEGCGKSTQIGVLSERLERMDKVVRQLREPGGTTIGEEIRHTLQHSADNRAMTPETELLLLCASRAQLVREVIRPALAAGEVVLCDRFFDSTVAYQSYGRGLELGLVKSMIEVAVGNTRPDLTIFLHIPLDLSLDRRHRRQAQGPRQRDRMEEADLEFFARVEKGYLAIAAQEPERVRLIDGTHPPDMVSAAVWKVVEPAVHRASLAKGRH